MPSGFGSGFGSGGWGAGLLGAGKAGIGPFFKVAETDDAFRIVPAGWTPVEGAVVLALGSDTPGRKFEFADGDLVEVYQEADFGTARLLRMTTHVRGPDAMPAGTRWIAKIAIDGVVYAERELLADREKDLFDMGANVSKFTGDHRLSLIVEFDADVPGVSHEVELPAWYLDDLRLLDS